MEKITMNFGYTELTFVGKEEYTSPKDDSNITIKKYKTIEGSSIDEIISEGKRTIIFQE